ncbi:cation efflux family protein [Bombardia bombarda]|uniref:Cation efflux family protein n=1 Tax=Bombardia bombarda TaxID=252184 RepID=A0AA39X9V4_9PEZI|nr:cation efflux family protein [Bombardia bombarda]
MAFKLGAKQRLTATIVISFAFFVSELAVAYKTKSLALMADSFHYMNDLLSFVVALAAIIISERGESPNDLSFGWQRAQPLGAFFNGVFLIALGISILLQSIERFISVKEVEDPRLVLIMGCVGLALNIISAAFLHATPIILGEIASVPPLDAHTGHRHVMSSKLIHPGRDFGMLGVLIHVIGDALNNLGVIVAALLIWFTSSPARFYADPGISMFISFMIFLTAVPLLKSSGAILLQSAPLGVNVDDVRHDLEKIPGVESVHELHIWRLDQKKAIATAHIVVSNPSIADFTDKAKTISECLHAYGVHSATLQPELLAPSPSPTDSSESLPSTTTSVPHVRQRKLASSSCQMICGKGQCRNLSCCSTLSEL